MFDADRAENLAWFLAHLDTPPEHIHVRGRPRRGHHDVWHDETGGSTLGSPATTRAFDDWVERDDLSTTIVEGSAIPRYRYPMRAAMARARGLPVPRHHPTVDVTLRAIARAGGDLSAAAQSLSREYPAMAKPKLADRHLTFALRHIRRRFSELALPTPRRGLN